jgi:hexulose-6-phosphate isomerase
MNNPIGVMQGRLGPPVEGRFQSFPLGRWRDEFAAAAEAELACIEWIFDTFGLEENPLCSDEGILQVRELSRTHGVAVRSCCADYFMERPFLRCAKSERDESVGRFVWLLERCKQAGIGRVVLPLVDNSRMAGPADRDEVAGILDDLTVEARRAAVEIHLETDLGPADFAAFLDRLDEAWVKVNYDSGNSAAMGYVPAAEFAAYGERIGSVHIKDRVRDGGTVPLGEGDADLAAVFEGLSRLNYAGDLILQVARGPAGEEVPWLRDVRRQVIEQMYLVENGG